MSRIFRPAAGIAWSICLVLVASERIDEARLDLEAPSRPHHGRHEHQHRSPRRHRAPEIRVVDFERASSALQSEARTEVHMMPGMDGMGQMMKILALCAVVGIAYKMISSMCASRKCDCRRFKIIAQCLLAWGWDEPLGPPVDASRGKETGRVDRRGTPEFSEETTRPWFGGGKTRGWSLRMVRRVSGWPDTQPVGFWPLRFHAVDDVQWPPQHSVR
ncbi:unnamed protein product [Durusdinium trenchii]|uniref:Uncharacterized protein n=1 Tax=Durusdinium trenchii TaxID=1381693 RepID=A0ABP0J4R1_9DINO